MRHSYLRRTASIAGCLVLGLAASSCGGDDDSADSAEEVDTTAAVDTTVASEPDELSPPAAADCIAAAEAGVEQGRQGPTLVVDREPIDIAELSGKTVWFISPDQSINYSAEQADGIRKAAEATGISFQLFDGQSSPDLFNQGIASAVAQNADGIILNSIDPSLVSASLAEAAAADIPYVNVMIPPGSQTDGSTFAYVSPDTTEIGQLMIDHVLVETGCESNVRHFTTSVFPFMQAVREGVDDRMAELCPECVLETVELDLNTLGTSTGPLVSSTLQRDPDVNYVIAGWDGLITFIRPAIEDTGLEVPIVGSAAVAENFDLIRSGSLQRATVAFAPGEYVGWLQFDEVLRAMLGAAPASNFVPIQLIDSTNVGSSNALEELFPGLAGYEDAFLAGWGM